MTADTSDAYRSERRNMAMTILDIWSKASVGKDARSRRRLAEAALGMWAELVDIGDAATPPQPQRRQW